MINTTSPIPWISENKINSSIVFTFEGNVCVCVFKESIFKKYFMFWEKKVNWIHKLMYWSQIILNIFSSVLIYLHQYTIFVTFPMLWNVSSVRHSPLPEKSGQQYYWFQNQQRPALGQCGHSKHFLKYELPRVAKTVLTLNQICPMHLDLNNFCE